MNYAQYFCAGLLIASLHSTAAAQTPAPSPSPTPAITITPAAGAEIDRNYVVAAAQGDMFEIAAAQVALVRAQSASVKRYARMLLQDHTTSLADLTPLASSLGITLPADVTAEQKVSLGGLDSLSGRIFDREYVHEEINDHEVDIDLAKTEARHGTDPAVRANAAKELRVLRKHLATGERVENILQASARRAAAQRRRSRSVSTAPRPANTRSGSAASSGSK